MGRPRMALGEWGKINLDPMVTGEQGRYVRSPEGARKPDAWRARANVRDLDGKRRTVERFAPTQAKAERALKTALHERVTPAAADAEVTGSTLLRDAAEGWWAEVQAADRLAPSTLRLYESVLYKHVVGREGAPAPLALLTLRDLKPGNVGTFLSRLAKGTPGTAKTTRSVLRSVLDRAVRHGAIPHNPVRLLEPTRAPREPKPSTRDRSRAFTLDERDAVVALADTQERAQRRDLGDLVSFLAGTGARIGEAIAVRWNDVDLGAGTARLGPTVVRVKGEGVTIQERGKTAASTRTVRLPEWLCSRLRSRRSSAVENEWGVIFPTPMLRLRENGNTSKDVRDLLDDAGMPWATSHTFRKTAATLLDAAGVSGREVANQLGHARPSMTQDVYMSRRTVTDRAADVL